MGRRGSLSKIIYDGNIATRFSDGLLAATQQPDLSWKYDVFPPRPAGKPVLRQEIVSLMQRFDFVMSHLAR
jgi:hypothetical protein